ncbi:MAG: hypothetical protein KAS94_05010, partial [Desulfobulbaceae bacterium]|nr:hypothetical protein [Desulfobulbaceae bacterium]
YDPTFGARPHARAIQRHIQDRLALQILEGDFVDGNRIMVDLGDGELTFSKD